LDKKCLLTAVEPRTNIESVWKTKKAISEDTSTRKITMKEEKKVAQTEVLKMKRYFESAIYTLGTYKRL
jgi:hypothetical protein